MTRRIRRNSTKVRMISMLTRITRPPAAERWRAWRRPARNSITACRPNLRSQFVTSSAEFLFRKLKRPPGIYDGLHEDFGLSRGRPAIQHDFLVAMRRMDCAMRSAGAGGMAFFFLAAQWPSAPRRWQRWFIPVPPLSSSIGMRVLSMESVMCRLCESTPRGKRESRARVATLPM